MSNDPFYNEGYEAYEEGVDFDECPYDEGTDGQTGWTKGWRAANEGLEVQPEEEEDK